MYSQHFDGNVKIMHAFQETNKKATIYERARVGEENKEKKNVAMYLFCNLFRMKQAKKNGKKYYVYTCTHYCQPVKSAHNIISFFYLFYSKRITRLVLLWLRHGKNKNKALSPPTWTTTTESKKKKMEKVKCEMKTAMNIELSRQKCSEMLLLYRWTMPSYLLENIMLYDKIVVARKSTNN